MLAGRNDFKLDHAVVEMVDALLTRQPVETPSPGFLAGGGDVPAGKIAGPGIHDFALLGQDVVALPDLGPRTGTVYVMHLIEIDMIRLQPFEAALAVFANLVGAETATVAVHFRQVGLAGYGVEYLGGQDNRITATTALCQPTPDNLLG